MRYFLIIVSLLAVFIISACEKSGCDDCTYSKQEFCNAMKEYNCNSAALTMYIDEMVRSCGQSEASAYISEATQNCGQGTLVCGTCD